MKRLLCLCSRIFVITHVLTHTCLHAHTHTHTHMPTHRYTHMLTHTCLHTHACTHIQFARCTCRCVYIDSSHVRPASNMHPLFVSSPPFVAATFSPPPPSLIEHVETTKQEHPTGMQMAPEWLYLELVNSSVSISLHFVD